MTGACRGALLQPLDSWAHAVWLRSMQSTYQIAKLGTGTELTRLQRYLPCTESNILVCPFLQAPRPPAPVPAGPERLWPHALGRAAVAGAAALSASPQPGTLRLGQRAGWVACVRQRTPSQPLCYGHRPLYTRLPCVSPCLAVPSHANALTVTPHVLYVWTCPPTPDVATLPHVAPRLTSLDLSGCGGAMAEGDGPLAALCRGLRGQLQELRLCDLRSGGGRGKGWKKQFLDVP